MGDEGKQEIGRQVRLTGFLLLLVCGCGREMAPPAGVSDSKSYEADACPWQYKLRHTWEVPGAEVAGLAVSPEGDVVLAQGERVRIRTADGSPRRDWALEEAATCIACDGDGRVYVGLAQRVVVYSPLGELLDSWGRGGNGSGELRLVTALAVDGAQVFVADAGNRRVHRFAVNGDFINDIGRRDTAAGDPGLLVPSPFLDCVLSPDGELWVANPGNQRVERHEWDGRLVEWWGRAGLSPSCFSGCCNPIHLAWVPVGAVGLVTGEKGLNRVKVHSTAGELLAYLGPGHFADDGGGVDVAAGADGSLFVLELAAGRVSVFAPERVAEGSADE